MKKILASILTLGLLHLAQAQETQTNVAPTPVPVPTSKPRPPKNPEQMAKRQTEHLQKTLGLSEDQKQKVYTATLARANSEKSIRDKYASNPDKKAMHREMKPVNEQFKQTMNSILSDEQKVKWEQERLKRKEMRQHHHNKKFDGQSAPPANTPAPEQK
ncbi:MAG: hypothetical protein ACXVC6_12620 [Bacteroidia bacterium]